MAKQFLNELVVKTLQVVNNFTHTGNFEVQDTLTANNLVLDSVDVPTGATVVAGSETDNVVNVVVTLLDADDSAIGNAATVSWYLSDDSGGSGVAATAPDGGMAIGSEGELHEVVAAKSGFLTTNTSGVCDIDVTESGTDAFYLVVILPTGQRVVSNAITTAA